MVKILNLFVAASAVMLLASCSSPRQLPVPALTGAMKERAKGFRSALAADAVRGVTLSEDDLLFFLDRPELLFERLELLGVNRIYVTADSVRIFRGDRGDSLEAIVGMAAQRSIGCEVALPQSKFVQRRSGNVFQREFGEERPLFAAVEALRGFNDSLDDGARLAGVTILAEMHRFNLASPELPSNALYLWGDQSYGVGRDNDILMKRMLDDFRLCKELAGAKLPLTLAVPAFYHERAAAGDLSCGKISDFLAVADRVVVFGHGSRPTDFLESVTTELKEGAAKKILIGVNLAGHASSNNIELRRRDWDDMAKIAEFLSTRARRYPSFDGLVLGPFKTLELLWEM